MTFWQALLLQAGYNAALVAVGAALLGLAAGAVGAFAVLRRRALVADAIAHATLPGVGVAFLLMALAGGSGRSLPGLMAGAAVSAGLGLLALDALRRRTRLEEDAAIGAVLSVFFGFGVVLLTVIQSAGLGEPAGLEGFLLGSTAGMLLSDALAIAGGALAVLAALALLSRALILVAFDPGQARAAGIPVAAADLALMLLVLAVTVLGLRLVGLVLIVALLIVPAVTARLWTDRAGRMALLSAGLGAASAWIGAALSASVPGLPAGPVIVLCACALFAVSLVLSPRGLSARLRARG